MTLDAFEALLKTAVPETYHLEPEKESLPYIVWSEYRKLYGYADNRPATSKWRVQVDFFTKDRRASAAEFLEALLAGHEIPFRYSRTYDRQSRVSRHLFDCEVL